MKLSMKREMKKLLAACMIMFVALTTFGGGISEVNAAAKNKAMQVSFSFDGKNDVKESEAMKAWYNNNYGLCVAGTKKAVKVDGLKMSGQIYIPKKVLAKKNSRVVVNAGLDLSTKKGYYGWLETRYSFDIVNTGKKIRVYAWDRVKEKNAKVGSYATCKAGKNAYKSYYVITLKNVPMSNLIVPWNEEEQHSEPPVKIKKSAKCVCDDLVFNVCGLKTKTSGKMYFDNLKLTSGKKTICNVTFTKKPTFYSCNNRDKEMKKSKVKIVNF